MSLLDDYRSGNVMAEIKKQIPFAIAKALNDVAAEVRKSERIEMENVFNKPTPYTLNSIFFKKATKQKFEVNIIIRNEAGKGTPPVKYLEPQIYGGTRGAKSSELQLREKGLMDNNMFWTPGVGARLNQYGNISPGHIVQIMSALKSFREAGYLANYGEGNTVGKRKSKNPLANKIFVQKDWGKSLYPGVYQRSKTGLKPLLIFLENPQYKQRFDFFKVGETVYDKQFEIKFNEAIQYALSTAR